MLRHFRKGAWLAMTFAIVMGLAAGTILAHEGRPVGDYRFIVGWLEEPAYEGARNAVSVQVNNVLEVEEGGSGEQGHHGGGSEDSGQMSEGGMEMADHGSVPVEGLEGSIQVEVTHVPTGVSRVFDLIAVFGEPGHYVATMVPTAAGVYEFRLFGDIEGTAIDEAFSSKGGGGGFDDIRTSAGLNFPEELPELREIERGVRGAIQTAQEAQDAALAAQESGGNTLAIVALAVGIVGGILGLGGIWFGLRGRQG